MGIGIGFWLDGEICATLAKIAPKRARLIGEKWGGGLEVEELEARSWAEKLLDWSVGVSSFVLVLDS